MHCNKIKILVCTENFLAYLLIFWTKMAYSSLKDYFKLYKIYCKIKTENFFRPSAEKNCPVNSHEIFNCPVRQTPNKKNCPVRQTFGKIVLLDRRPTRQTPLYIF